VLVRSLSILPAALLLFGQAEAPDAAKKELERLQGTWVMAALEVNGMDVGVQKVQGAGLTIKGDRYRVKTKGMDHECVLRLDPKKKPPAIDMIFTEPDGREKVCKGIYELDGDKLRICRGLGADQDRPNQLATWPGTNYFVVTWKREVK
jgi:uncharacterized protein (TIGR03067 family)